MKHLDRDQLARVVRELDESPTLVRWLVESRDENHTLLDGCSSEDLGRLQGQNTSINQMLDKVPDSG